MLTDNFWPDLAQTYIDLLYLLLLSARFRILDRWPFIGGAWRGRRYKNRSKDGIRDWGRQIVSENCQNLPGDSP